MQTRVLPLILAVAATAAAAPAVLRPYPQKVVTRHAAAEPAVPRALLDEPAESPLGQRVARASDSAVWIGSDQGLVRFAASAPPRDRWQYFSGRRYLADDDVRNLVADPAAGMWVRSKTGITHIAFRPMTLEQKAKLFEDRVSQRHDRYGMTSPSHLREPGNLASNQMVPDDNDGLWTAMYAAGECFRYAVTKSDDALRRARKATEAVLFLEQVTGRPGFPARSYIRRGDYRGAGGIWHWTPDGSIEWKADTSSDEIVGHFFLFGIAYDLLPDSALKTRIAATCRRIMDHIVEHGYHLTDVNDKPTRWGKWSLEYFSTPGGRSDSPLNSVELMAFLRTAHHITGDPKYDAEFRKVAFDLKYLDIANRYLEYHHEINYSDEELAMLPFYLLFRYEKDPAVRPTLARAMDQWWENIRRESNPLWTFIYLTGKQEVKVDLEGPVWVLNRIPLDQISWTVRNTHRRDVVMAPNPDRFRRPQTQNLLPPDERPIMKWNGNPFRVDGGSDGNSEEDGAFFLLPYWLGRYHRFLAEASQ